MGHRERKKQDIRKKGEREESIREENDVRGRENNAEVKKSTKSNEGKKTKEEREDRARTQ